MVCWLVTVLAVATFTTASTMIALVLLARRLLESSAIALVPVLALVALARVKLAIWNCWVPRVMQKSACIKFCCVGGRELRLSPLTVSDIFIIVATVGAAVGGAVVGFGVGAADGRCVGATVGTGDGGGTVGLAVGQGTVGLAVGTALGRVGVADGSGVGALVGRATGGSVGRGRGG